MAAGDVQHKDGVLNMENYGKLPVQAFEITERPRTTATPPSTFTYQRSAKRSIMLGLGIAPGASTEAAGGEDPLNAYSKMTDTACVLTYLSIVVGAGTFSLSKSMAAIGVVQGSLVLTALSVWNYAQSELLFRLPQLLERNFDTYTSIARACFSNWFSNIFLLLSTICWWCVCVFNLLMLEDTLERVAICWGGAKHRGEGSFAATLVCLLPGLAFICKTRGNQLVTVSKVAIRSMVAVAALEIVCAIGHYTTNLVNETPVRSVAWRTAGGPEEVGLASSISGMVVAFAGVGCWPYVLADMLHPQNAAKVVRKTSLIIGIFYLCIGIICYIGWGEDILEKTPVEQMIEIGGIYTFFASLMSILFSVKAVCAYPLAFRPLLREIERVIMPEDLPCIELRLPWALRCVQRSKFAGRVTLALLTFVPLRALGPKTDMNMNIFLRVAKAFFVAVHVLGPSLLFIRSLFIHKQILQARTAQPHETRAGTGEQYLGGSFFSHCVISGIVAATNVCISVVLLSMELQAAGATLRGVSDPAAVRHTD
mmetsp:Transcript_116048/g.339314  ORF Transcript_116048/g.339314 Transcript_116048/m.339314 type:complete len:538 (-) Transcript_116048:27-1640(-)